MKNMMKKINKELIFATLFAIICITAISAQTNAEKAKELLKLAEENTAFYETDFSADYAIVQEKPGEGTSATEAKIHRRDQTKQWTILVLAPKKDKGRGYLQQNDTIWFYDPSDKRFTFTSSRDKFQGTNANTSDFAPQEYYKKYEIVSANEVKLGALDCVLFELKANSSKVDYPEIKLWVTNDGLVRKKEDYSLSGQLLRTTAIPSYQTMNANGRNYAVPAKMLIVDNLRGKKIGNSVQYERTQITITNVSFKKLDGIVYTKPYLEMMAMQ